MKTTTLIGFIMASLLITGALACKKSTGSSTAGRTTCKITGITDNDNGTVINYTITYDGSGNMSSLTAFGPVNTFRNFSYGSNTIYVIAHSTSAIFELDTLTLDTNRLVTAIHQYYPLTARHSNLEMVYVTGNHLGYITTTNYSGVNTASYGWLDGDMIQVDAAGSTTNYTYDETTPIKDGDYLKIKMLLLYGTSYIYNTHMVKSISIAGSGTTNISFTKTSNGNIDVLTATNGSNTETLTYRYLCY